LNELVDKNVIDSKTDQFQSSVVEGRSNITMPNQVMSSSFLHEPNTRTKAQATVKELTVAPSTRSSTSSTEPGNLVNTDKHITVPTFAEMKVRSYIHPDPTSAGERVWALAQQCQGFSGRKLRRLPVIGWTGHTLSGQCSLGDAISGLEEAVEQALAINKGKGQDVKMEAV
jgi:pachytene checkpoint protein 2